MKIQSPSYKGPRRLSVAVVWVFSLFPSVLCDICLVTIWLTRLRPQLDDSLANTSGTWLMLLLPPTAFCFFVAGVYLLALLPAASVPGRVRLECLAVFALAVILLLGLLPAIEVRR